MNGSETHAYVAGLLEGCHICFLLPHSDEAGITAEISRAG